VMRALTIPGAAGIFNFVILIAALSAMNSQLYITTRMMFSLSRAGHAPAALGALDRRGVPVRALLLSSFGVALAAVLSVTAPKSAYLLLVSISAFGTLFAWLMIFVTHYRFRRARERAQAAPLRFRMRGFPLTTLAGGALMAAVMLTSAFTEAFRMTLVVGLPFLAVLCLLYWLRQPPAARAASPSGE
jgi:amino acid transporter, AAT family